MKKLFIFLLTATACASATGDATKIRVTTDKDVVKGCKLLGEVRGSGAWGNPTNAVELSGENAMRKKAFRMGADTVFMTYQTNRASAGDAYRCEGVKP